MSIQPSKAEKIEAVCAAVLEQEKATPDNAEIFIKQSGVFIVLNSRVLGQVIETNGSYRFQYLID